MRQKRSLSQVFLEKEEPCLEICENLGPPQERWVLEVGPGLGVLTRHLLLKGWKVFSIDFDIRCVNFLKKNFKSWIDEKKLQLHQGDALAFDLNKLIPLGGVVGCIPYHISTDLLQWVLPHLSWQLPKVIFLTQKEFAERVAASPGSKSYGSLSVYAQLRSKVTLGSVVSRHDFHPIPKVDSAILKLEAPDQIHPESWLKASEFLSKQAFQKRRKMLRHSLPFLKDYGASSSSLSLPWDLSQRCETLSPKDFLLMAQILEKKTKNSTKI